MKGYSNNEYNSDNKEEAKTEHKVTLYFNLKESYEKCPDKFLYTCYGYPYVFPPGTKPSSGQYYQNQFIPSAQMKANCRELSPDADPNYAITYYPHLARVNSCDEFVDHADAKFFAIKSFNESNVHKSMKYQVWSSTLKGNQRLDEAYTKCADIPLFLFYSVNESRRFVGVAKMTSNVNFTTSFPHWINQGKWPGRFEVQWIFIKDVPNNEVKSILVPDNENKPITNVRDTQEIPYEEGMMLLKKFKEYEHTASLLDVFEHYDKEEKKKKEAKSSCKYRYRYRTKKYKNQIVRYYN
jgi:hypothetical protein